jgi:hypothetical protein
MGVSYAAGIEQNMRPNMKSNLKLILPAIGVAALLASPALADSSARHHGSVHHYGAPARTYAPYGAYGYTQPSEPTGSSWCAARRSWDACHDPRENPQL